MNTKPNKQFFEEHNIAALKADKGKIPEAVKEILTELGNPSQAIPYYAIYGPGVPEPITFAGPITRDQVSAAIANVRAKSAEERVAQLNDGNWK